MRRTLCALDLLHSPGQPAVLPYYGSCVAAPGPVWHSPGSAVLAPAVHDTGAALPSRPPQPGPAAFPGSAFPGCASGYCLGGAERGPAEAGSPLAR